DTERTPAGTTQSFTTRSNSLPWWTQHSSGPTPPQPEVFWAPALPSPGPLAFAPIGRDFLCRISKDSKARPRTEGVGVEPSGRGLSWAKCTDSHLVQLRSPAARPGGLEVLKAQFVRRSREGHGGAPPAPRSFLCRALCPFPRVFAAEAVTADSEALAERQKRPLYVPEPYYPQSGWDRLQELFAKDTPVGGLLMAFQKYSGETIQEENRRIERRSMS
uniref:Uncharacterized protein n=1 Tax=Macaca mulatta TaxID=9544 RepID=A0A5F8AQC4_MACMU